MKPKKENIAGRSFTRGRHRLRKYLILHFPFTLNLYLVVSLGMLEIYAVFFIQVNCFYHRSLTSFKPSIFQQIS